MFGTQGAKRERYCFIDSLLTVSQSLQLHCADQNLQCVHGWRLGVASTQLIHTPHAASQEAAARPKVGSRSWKGALMLVMWNCSVCCEHDVTLEACLLLHWRSSYGGIKTSPSASAGRCCSAVATASCTVASVLAFHSWHEQVHCIHIIDAAHWPARSSFPSRASMVHSCFGASSSCL